MKVEAMATYKIVLAPVATKCQIDTSVKFTFSICTISKEHLCIHLSKYATVAYRSTEKPILVQITLNWIVFIWWANNLKRKKKPTTEEVYTFVRISFV